MKTISIRKTFIALVFLGILPLLGAEDRRTIPLDMYLIIDASSAMEELRDEVTAWLDEQVVDRFLMDGDRITIWAAGDNAQVIHSAALSGADGKQEIKNRFRSLVADGQTADFSGAMREAAARSAQDRGRLSHTMLITASARSLEPALTGSDRELFRWSRSEWHSRWQVLVAAPNIGGRVRQAAIAYMNSQR